MRIAGNTQANMATVHVFIGHAKALRTKQERHSTHGTSCLWREDLGKVLAWPTGGRAKVAGRHCGGTQVIDAFERLVQGLHDPGFV